MKLHIVGGFLGSGKTTAIAEAAKLLMRRGHRVGVITNDQGKYLVDTAFFQLTDVPAVEVTGGCFCCNYDMLDQQLDQLIDEARPDIVFAESVGSCADVVATVIKPLADLRERPTSFSVFTDARLLRRRLSGQALPFSDEIVYIFDQQIEEAGLLVVNKIDLLADAQADALAQQVRERYPDKQVRLQNSLDRSSVAGWVEQTDGDLSPLPDRSLALDYTRYAQGEARLGWLNREITLHASHNHLHDAVIMLLGLIVDTLTYSHGYGIGHFKSIVRDAAGQHVKLSFTALESPGWRDAVPSLNGPVRVLLNARVEAPPEKLDTVIDDIVAHVETTLDVQITQADAATFTPDEPRPTYRYE